MKIIIAPAKKMTVPETSFFQETQPLFQKEADELRSILLHKSQEELLDMYKCSQKTLDPVWQQLRLYEKGIHPGGPALLSYSGLAFRHMAPDVFSDSQWDYVQKHLRILSGMYGVLRPMDTITPYRLEMQNKPGFSLYEYWNSRLADALDDEVIINLASAEYAKAITPYRSVIDVRFLDIQPDGRRTEPGAYAKMARGTMVRWMAEHNIETPEQLQAFQELNYRYDPDASTPSLLVFCRPAFKKPGKEK